MTAKEYYLSKSPTVKENFDYNKTKFNLFDLLIFAQEYHNEELGRIIKKLFPDEHTKSDIPESV